MRRIRRTLLACSIVVGGLTSIGVSAADAAVSGYQTVIVLTSKTSSKVSVLAGSLRKDLTLQPTAQMIDVSVPAQHTGEDAVFLYNPGSGKDGLLRFWLSGGKIQTSFAPAPVSGRYRPFAVGAGILWYAPGPAADYKWTFATDGSHTSTPQRIDGDYDRRLTFSTRFIPEVTSSQPYTIWYGRGSKPDRLWFEKPDGTHTERAVSIGGDFMPTYGQFVLDDLYDTTDLLWYSNTGRSYVWSARPMGGCCPGSELYQSYDIGMVGSPGSQAVPVHFHPEDDAGYQEIDRIFTYRPGSAQETLTRIDGGFGSPLRKTTVSGAWINGVYRMQSYSRDDILLLDSSTNGQLVHLTSKGPAGTIKLNNLPPNPRAVVTSVGIPG
jgi:hypothetical protein